MIENEADAILNLYNEAIAEAPSRSLPEYIVFAEKIISREVEIAARVVCFMCAQGNKPEKRGTDTWKHVFKGSGVFETAELCRAGNIRNCLE